MMEASFSASKLETSSNALNFPVCSYVYEIQPLTLIDLDCNDDESEYFNARSCRPQKFKPSIVDDDDSEMESESDDSSTVSLRDAMHALDMQEEMKISSYENSKTVESGSEGRSKQYDSILLFHYSFILPIQFYNSGVV